MPQNMQSGYKKDTIMQLQAKPVVQDKFWIIEKNGKRVGTLRCDDDYVLTVGHKNYHFSDRKSLCSKAQISFNAGYIETKSSTKKSLVHGFSCKSEPFNGLYDLKHKLPLYTKTAKSQCFYCAGHYLIKFEHGWVHAYCPKLLTLSRNEYSGPFKTKLETQVQLKKIKSDKA